MATAVTHRELRQRLAHCQEAEDVARFEIAQDEAMGYDALLALNARHKRKMQRRLEERLDREDDAVTRSSRTLERRIHTLAHEEARQRDGVVHQWGLQVEAILRVLERDIQGAVENIEYSDMQRVKYFNKTVSVIHKNEGAERRELVNSERYEWLVLIQKFDASTLQLQLAEKLRAFREQQRAKIERFQQTSSTTEYRRFTRQMEAQRRARGIADGKKRKFTGVLPKTDDHLSPEFIGKAIDALVMRSEESHATMVAEEAVEFEAILRGLEHGEAIRAEEDRKATIAEQDGGLRAALRHVRGVERMEAAARQVVVTDERAGLLAIERKLQRESVAESRRTMADVTRQVTHQRKLEDRAQRMTFARTHFIERQVLLSQAMRTEPTEQEIFPAFTPRPPEMIAVQQQLRKMGHASTTPARRSRDDTSLQSELGNTGNFAAARANVIVRSLMAQAQASRVAIETEERRERYEVVSAAAAANPNSSGDRVAQAHERRVADQMARESALNERIQTEGERSDLAKSRVRSDKDRVKAFEKLHKDELAKRVAIKAKEDDWWRRCAAGHEAVAGKRVLLAFQSVVTTEEAARKEIVAAESRFRQTLRTSAQHHKPQSRVVKVEPLPPPKSKFDIVGAPPRTEGPQAMASASKTGGRSTSRRAEPPAGGSSLATSRAQSQAATPRASSSRKQRKPANNNNNGNGGGASTARKDGSRKQHSAAAADSSNDASRSGTARTEDGSRTGGGGGGGAATEEPAEGDQSTDETHQARTGNATPPPRDSPPQEESAAADDASDRPTKEEETAEVPQRTPTPTNPPQQRRTPPPAERHDAPVVPAEGEDRTAGSGNASRPASSRGAGGGDAAAADDQTGNDATDADGVRPEESKVRSPTPPSASSPSSSPPPPSDGTPPVRTPTPPSPVAPAGAVSSRPASGRSARSAGGGASSRPASAAAAESTPLADSTPAAAEADAPPAANAPAAADEPPAAADDDEGYGSGDFEDDA